MLSASAIDFSLDDDYWSHDDHDFWLRSDDYESFPVSYQAASIDSWGVTSIGRGFDWTQSDNSIQGNQAEDLPHVPAARAPIFQSNVQKSPNVASSPLMSCLSLTLPSPVPSSRSLPSHTPSSPRPRRRSSQQRVSLFAGRVSIAPVEISSTPPMLLPNLKRASSSDSPINVLASTRAPSSTKERSFLGERSISEYLIQSDIGRGAYGIVKRGREIYADGSLGPPLVIKQVIKLRILADCWKKHPVHGTIPIEIYVMSALSNISYVLPPRRPWDPLRHKLKGSGGNTDDEHWLEGKIVQGHPNICSLLDFFEDDHYYYLILPSSTPERLPHEPSPPSDLFDLVESFPQGLPPNAVRTYLGQIADALTFLHSQGIVHRDIKDENVVLGPNDQCILIDFGSSGLVKKGGWDTFSGTLDYASPEILRGERYYGKEQDVWAFGVVAYVLLVGECPFMTIAEAQEGLESPFANASIALDERCADDKEREEDGGGTLGDAAALVRACLRVDIAARPTFEKILQCRFLSGNGGWA